MFVVLLARLYGSAGLIEKKEEMSQPALQTGEVGAESLIRIYQP